MAILFHKKELSYDDSNLQKLPMELQTLTTRSTVLQKRAEGAISCSQEYTTCSYHEPDQSSPGPIFHVVRYSHQNHAYTPLLRHTCQCPPPTSNLILLYSVTQIQGGSNMTGTNCDLFTHKSSRSYLNHLVSAENKIMKLVNMQSPLGSSLLVPHIFPQHPVPKIFSLCSSLNVRDQASHP
jgi:hypothetical protein